LCVELTDEEKLLDLDRLLNEGETGILFLPLPATSLCPSAARELDDTALIYYFFNLELVFSDLLADVSSGQVPVVELDGLIVELLIANPSLQDRSVSVLHVRSPSAAMNCNKT